MGPKQVLHLKAGHNDRPEDRVPEQMHGAVQWLMDKGTPRASFPR
jgi:hypothetical protein